MVPGSGRCNGNTVIGRLEKVTYLCTQTDYYVVVSRRQIAFTRRKSGLKAVWLRETNYVVGLYHCAERPFQRMLLLISSTGSSRLALPLARPTILYSNLLYGRICTAGYVQVHEQAYVCVNTYG